jgi:hypothetical protein
MTQELRASLIEGDGTVHFLPTEGLRRALEQVVQENGAEQPAVSYGHAAVYEFLRMLKWEMRTVTSSPSATA